MARGRVRQDLKRWWKLILFLYLILVGASQWYLHQKGEPDPLKDSTKSFVEVKGQRLAYMEWGGGNSKLAPLILLHGSPGSGAGDWEKFGKELGAGGRRVIAIDRWGFGASERWVDDYSFQADADSVIGLMDQLGIKSAHVGGWSYGGGPAILLGDLHGDRIQSVSLISAIGIQKGEGSGSYMFEHGKYAVGFGLAVALPEAIPHFGLLPSRSARHSMVRDFWDCDQRTLENRLSVMEIPLFIIHGKHDPLIPAWVAERHRELNPKSRLVMLDGSHFYPFGFGDGENFKLAATELSAFLAAADVGRADKLYGAKYETSRTNYRALWVEGPSIRGYKPWWMVILAGMALGFFVPRTGGLVMGILGAVLILNFTTAVVGVMLGAIIKRGESRSRFHKAASVFLFGILGAIPGAFALQFL